MNYEQKYKEALERAVLWHKSVMSAHKKAMVEDLFPELKESEDEKIKREIRNFIWEYPDKLPERDKWLAWFEKQKNTSDKEYVFRPLVGDTIEKAAEQAIELDGKVVLAFNGAYIPVGNKTKDEIVAEYYNWLEKQGEKDPCIGCTNDKGCVTCENGNLKEIKVEHKTLNADKVIEWLENNLPNTYGFSVANKFKQDFGL